MIVGHSHTIKLVTKDWLEACLLQGKRVGEEEFYPEVAKNNDSMN